MFGVGTFLAGLGLFSIGAVSCIYDQNKTDRINREYLEGKYDEYYQSKYEGRGILYDHFDLCKIEDAIRKDWPRMKENIVFDLATSVAAKKIMEEQTQYKYRIPERFSFFDYDKYTSEEFRKKEK